MTTSGTSTFNLNLNDLVEEAFERCGAELRTGYDLRTARRSLNLLTIEWANRGINLWTIEQGSIPMVQGQIVYELPVDTIDLLEHVVRTQTGEQQTDITINRISVDTYSTIPNKNAQGRPIQVWINRQSGATYPAGGRPAGTNSTTGVDHPSDAGDGVTTQDIPFRFIPCMVAGLAYHLSLKIPGALERSDGLKAQYEELWLQAADEDREKAPLRLAPRQYFR